MENFSNLDLIQLFKSLGIGGFVDSEISYVQIKDPYLSERVKQMENIREQIKKYLGV